MIVAAASEELTDLISGYGTSQMLEVTDILLGDDGGLLDAMLSLGVTVGDAIKGIAYIWAIAVVTYDIFTTLRDPDSATPVQDALIHTVCVLGAVICCDLIFDALTYAGKTVAAYIAENATLTAADSVELETLVSEVDGIITVGYSDQWLVVVSGALKWGLRIEDVFVKVVSFSLVIEAAVLRAFAPFAVCDIARKGWYSPGVLYMKKYLGTYLKMCAVILTVYGSWALIYAAVLDNAEPATGKLAAVSQAWSAVSGSVWLIVNVILILIAGSAVMTGAARMVDDVL